MIFKNILVLLKNENEIDIIALEKICRLLDMQPGNIIKYVENE